MLSVCCEHHSTLSFIVPVTANAFISTARALDSNCTSVFVICKSNGLYLHVLILLSSYYLALLISSTSQS